MYILFVLQQSTIWPLPHSRVRLTFVGSKRGNSVGMLITGAAAKSFLPLS
jgi:hypothetical protein